MNEAQTITAVFNWQIKMPLPGNMNWLLTTEIGGTLWCNNGTDAYHTGSGYYSLDFDDLAPVGQQSSVPIYAVASGVYDSHGYDANGFGNWVKVDHQNGYKTLYGHMASSSLITSGSILQGDQLGTVGSTGNSSGTHLHFQIYYNGSSASTVAPLGYVQMEGLYLDEYIVGCNIYYPSTNTQ